MNIYEQWKEDVTESHNRPDQCAYMLYCDQPATATIPNPVIGPVKACKSCHDKYERLGA